MRVHIQYDWLVDDTLIVTTDFISQTIDVIFDFLHIKEFFPWNFLRENSPWFDLFIQMI